MKKTLISFLIIFSFTTYAQETWDYPIKPGTKEWATFETGKQMYDACQIPLDVLSTIGTKELLTVCLNYPLIFNYLAFNDERAGVNLIIKRFNGLWELSQREEGVRELIKVYADYPVLSKSQKNETSTNYRIIYKLQFWELVLSDNIFLKQINNDELEELRKIAVNKYADKLQNTDVYSLFEIKKTMLLVAVIMDKQNKTENRDIISNFIQNYNNPDANTLTELSKLIKE